MAEFAYDTIKKAFDELKASITKEAEEIRKQKNELQLLKYQVYDALNTAKFLRSNSKLVISAPEIVIGNVDRDGNLISSELDSVITLRGCNVNIHATGDADKTGIIECKSPCIKNIAVDPGIDGEEEVLSDKSNIITQARTISIESHDDKKCFVEHKPSKEAGLTIKSDTKLDIVSAVGSETRLKDIDSQKAKLSSQKATLSTKEAELNAKITATLKLLKVEVADKGLLTWGMPLVGLRTFPGELIKHQQKIADVQAEIYPMFVKYYTVLAQLAEINRKISALDKMKETANSDKGNYKTASTKATLSLASENITVTSTDGDDNIRDNKTAGIKVTTPHIKVETVDKDGALVKDSTIDINTKTYTLSTSNANYSDKKKRDGGNLTAEGDVNIFSKNVTIEAVDQKLNNGKLEEDKLAASGNVKIRAEKLAIMATDKDGKGTGSLKMNAKDVALTSMDVDPKSLDTKSLVSGGKLVVNAEKTLVGSSKKKSKLVQLAAEKVGIIGKDTAEMQQDGKAVVTLSGGNMAAGGGKIDLAGDTTIKGGANIKGETKSPKVSADQVEAKSAFKSPNINDTMGAGVPGAPGKPSAKLREEE